MSLPAAKTSRWGLVFWIGISFVFGAIGGAASIDAAGFYAQLELPPWAPPAGLFGPVWTALYIMMGIAAWRVWKLNGFASASIALTMFLVHLPFNALWSWLFFGWRLGALAFVDVMMLWTMIGATTWLFWRKSRTAGLLLLPYLLWVSFAAMLNFEIWQLNPQLLGQTR